MADEKDDFRINDDEKCIQEVAVDSHISLLPTLDFEPDADLVAQGWERRFMADPIRAREAHRMYTELGFEVHLESVKPTELSELCGDCRLATCHAYLTIYTRKL